ncbi:MAG: thiamine pyrophosphate-binding protein [Lautropia sp.]
MDAMDKTGNWGSDYLARLMRCLGLEYIALTPGSSFRGIHDSLVNHLGNHAPEILTTLHEEHAVAIAHGYAKVTGKPMGAFLHANVGLMHGAMAIFNAWCDRVPMLVFGATGPVDGARRRPWIDWLHTTKDQASMVRSFLKWDGEPASLAAARDDMLRAYRIASTPPCGPTYLCFDSELQEAWFDALPGFPSVERYDPPTPSVPAPALVADLAQRLLAARAPVILAGRVSRKEDDWARRVALAEHLGAKVITDFKVPGAFPTWHPLHTAPAGYALDRRAIEVLKAADLILSLDWLDLAGTLHTAFGTAEPGAYLVQVSLDESLHQGVGGEQQAAAPADAYAMCCPDAFTGCLLSELRRRSKPAMAAQARAAATGTGERVPGTGDPHAGEMSVSAFASQMSEFLERQRPACLVRTNLGWPGDAHVLDHPLDYLGYDGGGGVGSGPGMAVGAALALRGESRLPVAVLGDGDFLMGATALWTAVNYRIPLLVVVANNRSFYNDEIHQERVALLRGRPVENKGIGQRIEGIDIAALAHSMGAEGFGPVSSAAELQTALDEALARVRAGGVAVIDALVAREYGAAMASGLMRHAQVEESS